MEATVVLIHARLESARPAAGNANHRGFRVHLIVTAAPVTAKVAAALKMVAEAAQLLEVPAHLEVIVAQIIVRLANAHRRVVNASLKVLVVHLIAIAAPVTAKVDAAQKMAVAALRLEAPARSEVTVAQIIVPRVLVNLITISANHCAVAVRLTAIAVQENVIQEAALQLAVSVNHKVLAVHLIAIVAQVTVKMDAAQKMAESISVYPLDALARRTRIAAQTTVLSAVKLAAVSRKIL